MKKLYQRTFEQVLAQTCPPLNRVEEQRRALASRCSHTESEVTAMTTKPRRPIRILVAAAAVAAALTAGALAASGALGSIPLLSGGAFTSTDSVNWNEPDAGATVAPSQENVCFPVREEPDLLTVRGGSVYFTTETGEELDITGQFSEAEPYVYSYTASDGSAHDIVIGGSLEDYGYMEYVYDAGGSEVRAAVAINYGSFLSTILDFLIIAFAVFQLIPLGSTMCAAGAASACRKSLFDRLPNCLKLQKSFKQLF